MATTTPAEQQEHDHGDGDDHDDDPGELLELIPLGAGSEVGRSCVVASFFGGKKNVMFDCGIHPGFFRVKFVTVLRRNRSERDRRAAGDAFPPDHCAAVPFLVNRTNFKGRVFMTHATKAIFHMLMSDFVRLSKPDEKMSRSCGMRKI